VNTGFTLSVRDPERFTLLRGNTELRFRFVGQAERWVSNAIVAGTYQDASGAQYVLGTNGQATFPAAKPFGFTLAMDHVLNSYDYIYSTDLKKSRAASITRQSLLLNDISGNADETVSPTPRWALTRLTQPGCK
jgi:hypothetical protein